MTNLNDFRDQINRYFDNELEATEAQKMMTQVQTDPQLGQVFSQEQNLRKLIKNNFQRTCVSPELIQNIKDKIRVY